jgi:hypothetical protein
MRGEVNAAYVGLLDSDAASEDGTVPGTGPHV